MTNGFDSPTHRLRTLYSNLLSKRWSKFFEFAAKETGGCGKESMEDFFGMF